MIRTKLVLTVPLLFKKIFGQNPDLLKSFLNSILPLPDEALIEEVTYLTPEQTPRIPSMKNTIVDVKCRDDKGRIFIVEMQLHWSDSFTQRLLFGASRAYVQQLERGEKYHTLCPVYGLGIVNAIFEKDSEEWYHHYRTINVKDTSKVLEGLELVFLELPKFKPQTFSERKLGVLWLRFLKEINESLVDIPEEFLEVPELNKAMELAQESAYSAGELEAYDKYWDAISVEKSIKHDAYDSGVRQGLEKGREEGLEKGIEKATHEIALNSLKMGLSAEQISQLTKLSLEEINELKKQLH